MGTVLSMIKKKTIYVGMSGGVDSSVTALLLKEQGFDVVGVFIKSWDGLPTDEGVKFRDQCGWKNDRRDALRVAAKLGIPFKTYDLVREYRQEVIEYFFREYAEGRTPNPDVMCNRHIKFGSFLKRALSEGADGIATGHYVRIREKDGHRELHQAVDNSKDQSYFLWTLRQDQLKYCHFPIGELPKSEVRQLAEKAGLATAEKKDSQGICFVGEVPIDEFLRARLPVKRGVVVTVGGKEVGEHHGAAFYTIGQRHGLGIPSGLPYYVSGKDMERNIVYVVEGNNDSALFTESFTMTDVSWLNEVPLADKTYTARVRYRQPTQKVFLEQKGLAWTCRFTEPQRAVTPGQSIVIYEGTRMVGGGIIS